MNILIAVITSSNNKSRQDTINKTWNSDKNKNVEVVFISDEHDQDNNVFKLSSSSDYKSAEEKILNLIKELKVNNTKDWYFIVDDDTFVNIENLIEYTKSANPSYVQGYLAHNDWWNGLEYIQGGAGTLISKQTIDRIDTNSIVNYGTGFCDVALGLVFKANGIQIKGCNKSDDCLFLANNFNTFKHIGKEKLLKKITFHEIRTYDDMKEIMNFYNGA